jgi:hypothetical protein
MAAANIKIFELKYPFEHRGANMTQLEVRRPRVRDLKDFVKDSETSVVTAMRNVIANLSQVPPEVVQEIDLEDFGPIKSWFTDFLKFINPESEE